MQYNPQLSCTNIKKKEVKNMIKKVKCDICNNKFYIDKNKVKKVTENKGLSSLTNGSTICDAIDCPNCGCQKLLKVRLSEVQK